MKYDAHFLIIQASAFVATNIQSYRLTLTDKKMCLVENKISYSTVFVLTQKTGFYQKHLRIKNK